MGQIKPNTFGAKFTRLKVFLVFGGIALLSLFASIGMSPDPAIDTIQISEDQPVSTTPEPTSPTLEVIHKETNRMPIGVLENIYAYVPPETASKAEEITFAFQKNQCKTSEGCNLWVFDNKAALELSYEFDQHYGNSTLEENAEWNQQHYIFVADHFIGGISFDAADFWQDYPYKDFYYDELKQSLQDR